MTPAQPFPRATVRLGFLLVLVASTGGCDRDAPSPAPPSPHMETERANERPASVAAEPTAPPHRQRPPVVRPTDMQRVAGNPVPADAQVRHALRDRAVVDTTFGERELMAFLATWYPQHDVERLGNGVRATPRRAGDPILVAAWRSKGYRITVLGSTPKGDDDPSTGDEAETATEGAWDPAEAPSEEAKAGPPLPR